MTWFWVDLLFFHSSSLESGAKRPCSGALAPDSDCCAIARIHWGKQQQKTTKQHTRVPSKLNTQCVQGSVVFEKMIGFGYKSINFVSLITERHNLSERESLQSVESRTFWPSEENVVLAEIPRYWKRIKDL